MQHPDRFILTRHHLQNLQKKATKVSSPPKLQLPPPHQPPEPAKRKKNEAPTLKPATPAEIKKYGSLHSPRSVGALSDEQIRELAAFQDNLHHQRHQSLTREQILELQKKLDAHPFSGVASATLSALSEYVGAVVAVPTGAGKSALFPVMAVYKGRSDPLFGTTELRFTSVRVIVPRTNLAWSTAEYVAKEFFNQSVGEIVGVNTGLHKISSPRTKITYMTTGTAWMSDSKACQGYLKTLGAGDLLIIDEVHERQIHVDILLGIIFKDLQRRIAEGLETYKLAICSATINTAAFEKAADTLLFQGRPHTRKLVTTIIAEREGHGKKNPHIVKAKFNGRLGDLRAGALEALRLARLGRKVLVLVPNMTTQRIFGEQLLELQDDTTQNPPVPNLAIYAVNSRSDERERTVLSRQFEPDEAVITTSTISRSGSTCPGYDAVVDLGIETVPDCISLGPLRVRAQKLTPVSKSGQDQGEGRQGRVVRPNGIKDIVSIPRALSRHNRLDYPTPEILVGSEDAPTRLSLSNTTHRGDRGPRLFNLGSLPLMVPLNEKRQLETKRHLQLTGAVSDQGFLTKLGIKMRDIPASLESSKLIALALQTKDNTLVYYACQCAALIESQGILSYPTRQPAWARKEFPTYRSDVLRELDYFHHVKRRLHTDGVTDAEEFCAHNDLSYRIVTRVLERERKFLEVVNFPTPHAPRKAIFEQEGSVVQMLEALVQQSFLHYFMRRPTAEPMSLWSSPLSTSNAWRTHPDSMVNILGLQSCVGLPVARLEDYSTGKVRREDDRCDGKLYWTAGITQQELLKHLHANQALAPHFREIKFPSHSAKKTMALKFAPGTSGPDGKQLKR